jgi:hypothetical protein
MTFQELNHLQKRILLYYEYVKDGADSNTAADSAESEKSPARTLRKVFGYTDDMEIDIKTITRGLYESWTN